MGLSPTSTYSNVGCAECVLFRHSTGGGGGSRASSTRFCLAQPSSAAPPAALISLLRRFNDVKLVAV